MKYSKSRPKLIASAVLDVLSSVAYLVLSIVFFVLGAILIRADQSAGDGSISGEIAGAFASAIVGLMAIIMGIVCLLAFLISLVGTVIMLKSLNKDVSALKNSVKQIAVAAGFNYAACAAFTIGAIIDFVQSGSDTTLILGAVGVLVVAIFRAVSGALKTLAVKQIKQEQTYEQSESTFFPSDDNLTTFEIAREDVPSNDSLTQDESGDLL